MSVDRDELFLEASRALQRRDFKKAYRGFQSAAKLGHSSAQHNLGYLFDVGEGVRRDPEKALYWYKRAWRSDRQTGSSSNIAALYAELDHPQQAIAWWKRGVKLGDGEAALDLAKYLVQKFGVRRLKDAQGLLRQAQRSRRLTVSGRAEIRRMLAKLNR